jgi:hypothetical protein
VKTEALFFIRAAFHEVMWKVRTFRRATWDRMKDHVMSVVARNPRLA